MVELRLRCLRLRSRSCSSSSSKVRCRARLDRADQSFLLTDMLPSPTAAACRAPCSADHLRPLPAPGRVTWPLISTRLSPAPSLSHSPAPGAASEVWASQTKPRRSPPGRVSRAAALRDDRTELRAAPKPGLARGCSAAGGEGGGLPAQNQLDQLGAGPASSQGVAVQSARESGRGAEPKDRGQAELAAWKST